KKAETTYAFQVPPQAASLKISPENLWLRPRAARSDLTSTQIGDRAESWRLKSETGQRSLLAPGTWYHRHTTADMRMDQGLRRNESTALTLDNQRKRAG